MPRPPIAILGAGLAGLTLAHRLQKSKIPYVLYEQATKPSFHNYGISIPASLPRSLGLMSDSNKDAFKSAAVDYGLENNPDRGQYGVRSRVDHRVRDSVSRYSDGMTRLNRGKLEGLLREGLNIKWGHHLTGIRALDRASGKEVTRHELIFENGQTMESFLTVAADGVHSQARKSLLPHIHPEIASYVVINGRRKISKQSWNHGFRDVFKGSPVLEALIDGTRLWIGVNSYSPNEKEVDLSYVFSRPARELDDPLHRPGRENSAATNIPEEFYAELDDLMSGSSSKEIVDPFRQIFNPEKARQDRLLHWLMRSIKTTDEDLASCADEGVIFLGDAIHAMPILHSLGGTLAMYDAVSLAESISYYGIQVTEVFDIREVQGHIRDWYNRTLFDDVPQIDVEKVTDDIDAPDSKRSIVWRNIVCSGERRLEALHL